MMSRPPDSLSTPNRLLLRAAVLEGEPARIAWHQWAAHLDSTRLPPGSHPLLPLLYRNLERNGISGSHLPRLKGVYRKNWYRNQALVAGAREILDVLRQAGIDTLLLRTTALIASGRVDAGSQPLPALEIAVPVHRVRDAMRVLAGIGWRSATSPGRKGLDAPQVDRRDHVELVSGTQHLRLAWHLHPQRRYELAYRMVRDAACPAELGGAATSIPSAEDLFLLLCSEGQRWHPVPSPLWAAQAYGLLHPSAPTLNPDRVASRAYTLRLHLPLATALKTLNQLLDRGAPPGLFEALNAFPVSLADRLEMHVQARNPLRDGLRERTVRRYMDFLRSSGPDSSASPLALLRYLQKAWGADRLWTVPAIAAMLALRRLRGFPQQRPTMPRKDRQG